MKLGCGPLNVDDMSESRLRETVVGIEAKLYDFVWLGSEAEAIIAGSVAAAVSRDLRILVELDRTLDPLRDAEDLCVLDQLCEGRVGLVLGRAAAADVELVQELRRALDGGRVRGVRVFPRNAQLSASSSALAAPRRRDPSISVSRSQPGMKPGRFKVL